MDTATMDLKLAANIVFDQLVCCYTSSAQWGWLSSVNCEQVPGGMAPPDFPKAPQSSFLHSLQSLKSTWTVQFANSLGSIEHIAILCSSLQLTPKLWPALCLSLIHKTVQLPLLGVVLVMSHEDRLTHTPTILHFLKVANCKWQHCSTSDEFKCYITV